MHRILFGAVLATSVALAPSVADAFCGFYVSGAGADLFNNASQVVMMRDGTRTVLSMQNDYQGPPESFAMVVPVPVVLHKENVKTLPDDVFDRVDTLAAPRLVEYWEQDPCQPYGTIGHGSGTGSGYGRGAGGIQRRSRGLGVTVEDQFEVGEYDVVILSAIDSTGLDTWLREENYQIPDGAEAYLKPYVEGGSKFFVAKVNAEKVVFKHGRAVLSPLRFHYDSALFSLPIRLGMMNSSGTQDLIVHILARGQRYEVANYRNLFIPTNLDVKEEARERFGEFYAALFDRTLEKEGVPAVVTEYAWDASSCDPCPTPPLTSSDLALLGADVLSPARLNQGRSARFNRGFTLTRLHARYSKGGIEDDLVFTTAAAVAGGRERRGQDGALEMAPQSAPINNFQARYAIRHAWTGPIQCETPVRGVWGGPPAGQGTASGATAATDLGFVPRGQIQLAQLVAQNVPEIGLTMGQVEPRSGQQADSDTAGSTSKTELPRRKPRKQAKGCQAAGSSSAGWALLLLVMNVAGHRRRRRHMRGDI